MIFWWFFADFLGFVWFYFLKQNLQKSSNNYQKIIKKSSFCWKNHENQFWQVFLVFFKQNDIFLMIFWWFPRFCLIFFCSKTFKHHQKIIKKSSFCWENENPRFWQVFLVFSRKPMIFWWFFVDFLGFVWFSLLKQNLQTSSKNYQKIIVLLEKQWKSRFWQVFLVFSSSTMIFWWFFDDFLGFVWFYLLKQNLQKSSNNYQKIIKKSSFCWKNHENPRFWQVFLVFSSKTMLFWWFFDDFLGFVWFSLWSKTFKHHQKIIKKSSFCWKNNENPDFGKFSWFFQATRWFFDDFLMIS